MAKSKLTLLEPEMIKEESAGNNSSISKLFKNAPWVILIVVILIGGVFVYQQSLKAKSFQKELEELKQNPQKATEEETKALLDKVGALIEMPNEQPTIATVTDLAPLKDQPFFANAQVNDKVLIFSVAKKAVLYRPSTNKVIEIAPVDLDAPAANVNTNSKANSNSNSNTNSSNTNSTTNSNKNTNKNTNSSQDIE